MNQNKYPSDYFTLVQENDRLVDKPLKTKQLSYLQDAMLRFTKNKYNLIATIILGIMILMSIFVPIITPKKYYEKTNASLISLPPRIPLLEKLGIFDGSKVIKGQPIDYSTIDPITGLGYPTAGYSKEYIYMDTLVNTKEYGSTKSPQYVGGTNDLYIDNNKNIASISSKEVINIANSIITLDINNFSYPGKVELYLLSATKEMTSWGDLTFILQTTTSGVIEVDTSTLSLAKTEGYLVVKYSISGSFPSSNVSLNGIEVRHKTNGTVIDYSGYPLSMFDIFVVNSSSEGGVLLRKNAERIVATFRYNLYKALQIDKEKTIPGSEYNNILDSNPGMRESIVVDPSDPNKWTFGEGYPLVAVLRRTNLPGTSYYNYIVVMDGLYAAGVDDIPYFIFGTDVFGKDLFTMIWLGLRTSLILGILSSLINIVVGVIWGATSAYYGGQVDILMERFTDILSSFPQITMIAIITSLIGPGFLALLIFMVYDGWIGAAAVTRMQFYRYKGKEYVLAARTLGASDRRIIFKHILPNTLGTIVTRVILSIPSVIFLELNLSYLGFGIGNGQSIDIGPIKLTGTSIGVILFDGQQQFFSGNTWLLFCPAVVVALLMITFNMFGNALRDALNPQLRGSE